MAKFTKEDINERLKGRPVVLIGEFNNTSSKSVFKCLDCDNEWSSYVTNVLHKKYNCPKCAGNKPLSIDDVRSRLDGRDIEIIGDYTNSISKSTFVCGCCNGIWNARVSAVLSGQGCPTCNGAVSPSVDMIGDKLNGRDIKFIGPYKNNSTSTEWQCLKCDNHWFATPGNLLVAKTGCPNCAEYGFNPDKSAWEYGFTRDGYLKYGITNDLTRRLYEHRKHGEIVMVHERYHEQGHDALKWERYIKRTHGGRYATKEQCPDGWTETLPISLLERVIGQ